MELLLVIVILGILAALILGNFITSLKKGRDARRKGDLEQFQRALELYYEDNRAYPLSITWGGQICHPNGCGTKIYMEKVSNDPSSGNYGYASDGTYYHLYACLENTQQILPYTSTSSTITCSTNCFDPNNNSVSCIWGISSTNSTP